MKTVFQRMKKCFLLTEPCSTGHTNSTLHVKMFPKYGQFSSTLDDITSPSSLRVFRQE